MSGRRLPQNTAIIAVFRGQTSCPKCVCGMGDHHTSRSRRRREWASEEGSHHDPIGEGISLWPAGILRYDVRALNIAAGERILAIGGLRVSQSEAAKQFCPGFYGETRRQSLCNPAPLDPCCENSETP